MTGTHDAATRRLIPHDLTERFRNTPERRAWLIRLPELITTALEQWRLTQDLPEGATAWSGYTALALPVRQDSGNPAVLKISFPEPETAEEATALQLWGGNGAVTLIDHDPRLRLMLLERLDDELSLADLPMKQAIPIWGSVLRRLSLGVDHRPGWQLIPRLLEWAARWPVNFGRDWQRLYDSPGVQGTRKIPRWLLEAAITACETELRALARAKPVLVHADLHYENILAIPRHGSAPPDDFLAIDPQAIVGVPEFAVAPALWNRLLELPADSPGTALLERFEALCSAAGLDSASARRWSLVREAENALWYAAKPGHERDLHRSLWVASILVGQPMPELPHPHLLDITLSPAEQAEGH